MLCALLAGAGAVLASFDLLARHGLSVLTLSLVLGIAVGNLVPTSAIAAGADGIAFAKQRLLRAGVVLYGLRLTVQDIGQIGWVGVAVDAAIVCTTFALACWVGIRWLKLDRRTVMLIGIGSSICGAAAVVAAAPVVKSRSEEVAVAVASVVVFGTLATFLYPVLFAAGAKGWPFPSDAHSFGLYVGSTVHEVAQVIAAARTVDPQAADAAVVAKMVRVMMLASFLLALSFTCAEKGDRAAVRLRDKASVPWFAVGFIALVLFNSLHWLDAQVIAALVHVDTALLAMAMCALGLGTRVQAVRQAGRRPLQLALVLFLWLVLGGAAVNTWVPRLLG